MSVTFQMLRIANVARCNAVFHGLRRWSPSDWGNALAGEVGEACNLIKKIRRMSDTPESIIAAGHRVTVEEYTALVGAIGMELADTVIYADLTAARLGLDLGECVARKFNRVSVTRNAVERLPYGGVPYVVHNTAGAYVALTGLLNAMDERDRDSGPIGYPRSIEAARFKGQQVVTETPLGIISGEAGKWSDPGEAVESFVTGGNALLAQVEADGIAAGVKAATDAANVSPFKGDVPTLSMLADVVRAYYALEATDGSDPGWSKRDTDLRQAANTARRGLADAGIDADYYAGPGTPVMANRPAGITVDVTANLNAESVKAVFELLDAIGATIDLDACDQRLADATFGVARVLDVDVRGESIEKFRRRQTIAAPSEAVRMEAAENVAGHIDDVVSRYFAYRVSIEANADEYARLNRLLTASYLANLARGNWYMGKEYDRAAKAAAEAIERAKAAERDARQARRELLDAKCPAFAAESTTDMYRGKAFVMNAAPIPGPTVRVVGVDVARDGSDYAVTATYEVKPQGTATLASAQVNAVSQDRHHEGEAVANGAIVALPTANTNPLDAATVRTAEDDAAELAALAGPGYTPPPVDVAPGTPAVVSLSGTGMTAAPALPDGQAGGPIARPVASVAVVKAEPAPVPASTPAVNVTQARADAVERYGRAMLAQAANPGSVQANAELKAASASLQALAAAVQ